MNCGRAEKVAGSIERALKGEVKIADLVDGRRQPRERTKPLRGDPRKSCSTTPHRAVSR